MGWWQENRMRMIQFNLQQEDAAVDVARVVAYLKEMHANAVMTGAGGIVAYYPTALPYHYRSPFLGAGDMLGGMVDACHKAGIRVIARFDFSKIHESIAAEHEDWLYRDEQGQIVNYHGMVHACLSGGYEWEHAVDILTECLGRYPVDGIYLNMFGYATRDYDGVDHGLCHCENCRRLYREETGRPYPAMTDAEGVARLRAWQGERVLSITRRIREAVKSINPEISICTHSNDITLLDMTHTESNTALNRPLPLWAYASFDNARLTNDQRNGVLSANCCINAADIGWRFMGVSNGYNKARLWQQIAAGGQPEWCIVGTPDRYPDSKNFDGVREVYAFHEQNERYLGQRRSLNQIAVVRSSESFPRDDGRMDEYRGVVRALKEAHYQFDIVTEENVARLAGHYGLIILPDSKVSAADLPASCHVLATGGTFRGDAAALKALFGAEFVRSERHTVGAYLNNDNKRLFKRLPKCDWVLLNEDIDLYRGEGELPYMAAGVFGPVEIAGGVFPSEFRAVLTHEANGRKRMLLPWWPGRLYARYGYIEHRDVLLDLVDSILGPQEVQISAPDRVDAYYDGCPGGRLIQLVNLTGFSGTTVHEPVPVSDITVSVPKAGLRRAVDLRSGKELPLREENGRVTLRLPVLNDYAAVLLED